MKAKLHFQYPTKHGRVVKAFEVQGTIKEIADYAKHNPCGFKETHPRHFFMISPSDKIGDTDRLAAFNRLTEVELAKAQLKIEGQEPTTLYARIR
jgi:hypothetical protein